MTRYITTEVEVDLDEFTDEELIEELEERDVNFRYPLGKFTRAECYLLVELLEEAKKNRKIDSSVNIQDLEYKLRELSRG